MQTPAELVPIPDTSGCVPDASGMRRDFEFQQISANNNYSGKIPAEKVGLM